MENLTLVDHKKNYESFHLLLTDQQKKLHCVDDINLFGDDENNGEQNVVNSYFYLGDDKTMWSYSFSENMKLIATQDSENSRNSNIADTKYTFLLNNEAHVIFNSQIEQPLPSIVFQPGYEGRWCPDILVVIFKSGNFYVEQLLINTLDSIYNLEQIDKEKYHEKSVINKSIGNVEMLQKYSNIIPEYDLKFRPPWCYNEVGKCFPILFCGSKDQLKHEIVMVKNIEKLLIVRNISTGKRVEKLSSECIKKIDGYDWSANSLSLSQPSITGFYAYKDPNECDDERNKCYNMYGNSSESIYSNGNISSSRSVIGEDSNKPKQVPYKFVFKDRKSVCSSDDFKLGETKTIELDFIDNVAPFKYEWFVQNQTSVKNNNYTNGSTNAEDSEKGFNVFDKISVKIDNKIIVPSTRGHRFCQLGCQPSEIMVLKNGSGIYTTAVSSRGIHPGNSLSKISLTIELKNMNPYLDIDEENYDKNICNDSFKVFLMATYYREIIFHEYPKDDQERATKTAKITIL